MIENKIVKIKKTDNLTSLYIDENLKTFNYNVLSWAIVEIKDDCYILNVSVVE
ncbi:MAG: hypothetical protein PHV37_02370 [Candidatus Gastranaerophilales bacterium]|nr:hypothetical protein [Candidatus Gastranaerophilales bacterium]